jgi:hypothetical protein
MEQIRDHAIGGIFMNMKLLFLPCCIVLLLSCWLSPEAIAAPSVTIAPVGDSVYGVLGNDLSNVSGMDITIRYDPTALAAPQVAQGALVGGALMAINVSIPGNIRLALVRVAPINGSGTVVTITFTRLKSAGTDIQSLVSSVINSAGRNIPVASQVMNPVKTADSSVTTEQKTGQSTPGASPSTVPGTSTPAVTAPAGMIGMVAPPAGASSSEVRSAATSSMEQPTSDEPQPGADTMVPSEAAKDASSKKMIAKATEPERKKIMPYPGVLERFKEYKGEKTPGTLTALFETQDNKVKQDPPIVLSNGKDTLTIVLELKGNNFLLDGVNLVSLKNKEKNSWILELLPDSGTFEATVSVPGDNQLYVIPLTVAPPVDVNATNKLTEADFKRYLKEKGTAKAPSFDLNKDGRRDYIDDFIFTANYLVQQDGRAKQNMNIRK